MWLSVNEEKNGEKNVRHNKPEEEHEHEHWAHINIQRPRLADKELYRHDRIDLLLILIKF